MQIKPEQLLRRTGEFYVTNSNGKGGTKGRASQLFDERQSFFYQAQRLRQCLTGQGGQTVAPVQNIRMAARPTRG